MKTIKLAVLSVLSVGVAHATPTIQNIGGGHGGIQGTHITHTPLSENLPKFMATIPVLSATARGVTTAVNEPAMVQGTHTACFETFWTTEGDYKFTLTIGGEQTIIAERIPLPAHQRTCITHDTYHQVSFPSRGQYTFTAESGAGTASTGWHTARNQATISVN